MARTPRLREFRSQRTPADKRYQTELRIDSLGDDGRGIARHKGKVVFVENALAGETVRVQVEKTGRRFDEAVVLQHVDSSPERTMPACLHYQRCGGCQLQHLDYPSQLAYKQARLEQLLEGLQDDLPIPEVLSGAPLHYRHRVRLAFTRNKNGLQLGFREARSHRVVPLTDCPVLQAPLLDAVLHLPEPLLRFLHALKAGELVCSLGLDGRVGLSLYGERSPTRQSCVQTSAALSESVLCLFSVWDRQGQVWHNDSVAGLDYPDAQNSFLFEPSDFTQVNPQINAQMLQRVIEWLDLQGTEQVADFFCGLGNFALPLAGVCREVYGFELDEAMVDRAQRNAAELGRSNVHFRSVDLFKSAPAVDTSVNKAVLDPPRSGAQQLCLTLGEQRQWQRLVYVSCDPKTLKRDLGILIGAGFRIEQAALADMFPQTRHLESLVLLTR